MSDVTIPEDILDEARKAIMAAELHAARPNQIRVIARAILAERERCQMALVNASNNPPDRWAWRSSDREALDWGWTKGLQFGAAVIRAASGEST